MNKIKKLSKEEIIKRFEELPQNKKIDILIKWFGVKPLKEELFKSEEGLKYIEEVL